MSPDEQPTIFTPLPNGTRKSSPGIWQAPTVEEMQAMLPQYEVLEILGRGGMGAVYKGRQKSLKRLVAIKILPLGLADDEMKFTERFQNEAQTMAAMNHPAIVSVHDFGETPDGLLYFIMEFVDGTDVQKMIHASGRLTEEHALAITAHVCDALSYAHKRGVIHRDIKPANILIDQEGHIKVADFGLAKMHDPSQTSGLTKSNMAMGTPDYVAPEVLSPGRVADHRADLYAVGVMLYQMLTGEVPRGMFKLPSQKSIGSDVRFDEIICKALEPEPEDRYQSAMDVRHALDVILTTPQPKEDGTGIVSASPVPQRPVTKKPRPPGEMSQPPTQKAPAQNAAAALKAKAPPKKQSPATLWLSTGGIVMVLGLASFIALGGKPEPAARVQPASASPVDATFMAQVAAAPAARQVELVEQKIEALNGTKVSAEPTITGEKLTGLRLFRADATEGHAPDISPLAALKDLDSLRLEYLKVGDISCLRGLKLVNLTIWDGEFNDLSVLQSHPLQTLSLKGISVSDFSVLQGKALQRLDLEGCVNLSDLSFIKGMPLTNLHVTKTKVRDLSPIAGLPLVELYCDPEAKLDPALLASIPTLKKINLKHVSEWPGGSSTPPAARSSTAAATPLTTSPPGSMTTATGATKDAPFENSLGMKFVPVPGTEVLFCIHETRHRDYAEYAKMAKESVDVGWKIQTYHGHEIERDAGDHPVVNVSWEDAQTFCKWLSEKEGKTYRLPTDREWSLAVGIGREEEWKSDTTPATVFKVPDEYPWGSEWPPPQGAGNYSDESRRAKAPRADAMFLDGYDDGFPTTAPVMSFEPNQLGLFDLGSNVSEWCEDWYSVEQKERVLRGASWDSRGQLSSSRLPTAPEGRSNNRGFRVVLEIGTPSPPPSAATCATAPSSPNGKTIDLLSLVDVKRDTIAGEWVLTADGLAKQGPGTTDKGAPRLQLPYVPPEEYDFEVEFTAVADKQSVGQIISAQSRLFSWIVAGNKAEEPTAGFELFDNNPTSRPSEVVAPMERNLEEGRRYRSRVEVRKAGLRGFLDGVELVNWSGDFKRLSPGTPGNLRDDKHLGLRAARDVIFHKVTVREITGTGKVDAGVNATQSADPAGSTVTWTDWMGSSFARGQFRQSGFVAEKDGITTDQESRGVSLMEDHALEGPVRLTYLLRDSKGAKIIYRNLLSRDLYVAEDSGIELNLYRVSDGGINKTMLASEKYPATLSRIGERTLEFRVEGDALKATVNGTFSLSVRDATFTTGPGFSGVVDIRKGLLLKKVEIQGLKNK